MAEQNTRMVLRTVYLPPDLDEKLRVSAFRKKVTKNDLIRDALARELASETSFSDDKNNSLNIEPRRSVKRISSTAKIKSDI